LTKFFRKTIILKRRSGMLKILIFSLYLLMPSSFRKVQADRKEIRVTKKEGVVRIEGSWIEGLAPTVRLETQLLQGEETHRYKGFYIEVKGDGKDYKLRAILPDKAGFLDQILVDFKERGKRKLFFPMEKRVSLLTSVQLARKGYPLLLLINPVEKGNFSIEIGKIEWVEMEEKR